MIHEPSASTNKTLSATKGRAAHVSHDEMCVIIIPRHTARSYLAGVGQRVWGLGLRVDGGGLRGVGSGFKVQG